MRTPLPREEVIKAIEHGSPSRVPMMLHFWLSADRFEERQQAVRDITAQYPDDVAVLGIRMPAMWDDRSDPNHIPGYSWMNVPPPPKPAVARGHDANVAIEDWSQLPAVLDAWPRPDTPTILDWARDGAKSAAGRYKLATFWFCLYERMWSIRGMENILTDFYLNPEPVHQFMDALTDFYCGLIRRMGSEMKVDGIFTSDDIGMQTGPMFSRDIFLKFFKPRYAKIFKAAHDAGMHFWLHTCGDVRLFMDDLIEVGLDVIHPIQKYTMNEPEIAQRFGGRICFWAGMDVQQILPRGTPDDVRREVRFMIDTYDRPDGGCMITAGNGITPDVPVENLRAFFDETYEYGMKHRR
jgi:uroporphyrinogen decarboxylase